jgi:hypothetical protein
MVEMVDFPLRARDGKAGTGTPGAGYVHLADGDGGWCEAVRKL